ncbi:MAG: hypothetical protein WD556_07760 [Actinomycetota bacterium]
MAEQIPPPPGESMPSTPNGKPHGNRWSATTALVGVLGLLVGLGVGYVAGDSNDPPPESAGVVTTPEDGGELPPAEGVEEESPPEDSPAAEATETSSEVGATIDNAVPVRSSASVGEWEIEVVGFTPNANGAVMRENQFNTKPKEDEQYVLVTLKTTYAGAGSADPFADQTWAVVSSDGNLYEEKGEVWPKDLTNVGRVPSGVSGQGNVGFLVPTDDARSLTLYIEAYGRGAGEPDGLFFALQ